MSTIGSNFTLATAGTDDTLYGFSYANVKTAASESSDTDGFLITSAVAGGLYYNTGSTAVGGANYLKITDFTTAGGGVQVRITGIFINNVKVSGSDPKMYWSPNEISASGTVIAPGTGANVSGVTTIFTVKAVDNVDGVFGNGNDTFSTDGATNGANASINLTPVNDAPVFAGGATASVNAAENQTTVTTVSVSDVDGGVGPLAYSLTGADAARFNISSGGVLTFNPAPNFEAPSDAGNDGVYNVTVTANDGAAANNTASQAITVTLTNANDAPVNTVPGGQTADASRTVTFAGSLSVADEDVGASVTTTLTVANGTFTAVGAASGATVGALNAATLVISGTPTQVTAALNGLQYTGNLGFGGDSLSVSTSDGTATDLDTVAISAGVPTVVSVTAPANALYNAPDVLSFTVTFDQTVNVVSTGGIPTLALTIGVTPVVASYASGTGSTALVFTYTVSPGNNDADGVALGALSLNGGTIKNAGGANASLTLTAVDTTGVIVDTLIDTPTVSLTSDTGSNTADGLTKAAALTTSAAASDVSRTYTIGSGSATSSYTAPTADGTYTVVVRDTDTAGNTASASATFTLDTTPPTATFNSAVWDSGVGTLVLTGVDVQTLGRGMAQVPAAATQEDEVRSLWRPAFLAHAAAIG
jgi:hypothetical protein